MVKITKVLGVGKDGFQKGGVPIGDSPGKVGIDPRSKVLSNQDRVFNQIEEGNVVEVRGTRRMLKDKSKKATWY